MSVEEIITAIQQLPGPVCVMTHTRTKKAFPVIIGIVLMITAWNCNKRPLDNSADSQQTLPPTNFTVQVVSDREIRLQWDYAGKVAGFRLEGRQETSNFKELAQLQGSARSYTDSSGVQVGMQYRYRLSAFTSLNRSGAIERAMNLIVSAPSNLQITFDEGHSVRLLWDDLNEFEHGYLVERQVSGQGYQEVARVASNQTGFVDRTVIQLNQEYRYRVAAYLAQHRSDWKESAAFYLAPNFLVFVSVPGGTFTMGDVWGEGAADERPAHEVTLSPFYMSKYEITFTQFDAFCTATGRSKPNDVGWGRGNQPVISISWLDARAYCEWLSKQLGYDVRLPTEAEWEYAARSGGKNEKWAGTSDVYQLGDFAWFSDNSDNRPHIVGQKQANGLGLNDMAGNVWEWCFDWYDSTYYGHSPLQNPTGPPSGVKRVLRGGSWGNANSCRTTNRSKFQPDVIYYEYGFRIVRPSVK